LRVLIAAIGKFRSGPEQELFATYIKRIPWKVELRQLSAGKAASAEARMEEEAVLLLEAAKGFARKALLDERGKNLSSREFADQLKAWQLQGDSSLAFMIGGADGAADSLRKKADIMLSFGRASWPHMLVRPMLAEQLYRAHALISGHPYHRD
jgi:23S rRNA (pseudouridine1915-N3)-methyltransferase